MDPIIIGLIITAGISIITLVLQFLQSAKIHNFQISSCIIKRKSSSSSSSDSDKYKSKKKHKKHKKK